MSSEKLKKYNVNITYKTIVQATDENDAKIIANDELFMGDCDFEIDEVSDE